MTPDTDGACQGKHPFHNRRDANAAVRNHHHRGHKTIHTYRCPICNYWHVGAKQQHPPRPKRPPGV